MKQGNKIMNYTKGLYVFDDGVNCHKLLVDCNSEPKQAQSYLRDTVGNGLTFKLPKFEADDFLLGFATILKPILGSGHMTIHQPEDLGVKEGYGYMITADKGVMKPHIMVSYDKKLMYMMPLKEWLEKEL